MMNKKGFTLVEMLVAIGLSSVLVLLTMGFYGNLHRQVKSEESRVLFLTDATIGLKYVWKVMSQVKPSMNNLKTLDDDGKDFFAFPSDNSTFSMNESERKRQITLKRGGKVEVIFLADDPSRGPSTLYLPSNAYNKTQLFGGVLSYVALNQNDYITDKIQGSPPVEASIMSPGKMVLLSSPVYLKDVSHLTDENFNSPSFINARPRNLSFLGKVNSSGSDLVRETLGGEFDFSHPAFPSISVANPDQFLRYLPPSLAGGAYAYVSPITVQKFVATPSEGDPTETLVDITFHRMVDGKFDSGFILFSRIKHLKFIRDFISSPIIKVEVQQ